MRVVRLMLVGLWIGVATAAAARSPDCRVCFFGGLCLVGDALVECPPTEAGCVLNGGILVFNSEFPNIPAYWTLVARDRFGPNRLVGRLKVSGDATLEDPAVPGFPGRCRATFCRGRAGRFDGTITGDGFSATASWRNGETCEFHGTLGFGLGAPEPNAYTCRTAAGDVMSSGVFRIQGLRLSGCLG